MPRLAGRLRIWDALRRSSRTSPATARLAASPALPRLAGLGAALVGAVNVASTLTPNISWRGHLLLEYEPVEAMRLFHALALPAGAALLLVAPYLAKRRRRAFTAAIALMVALGAFDLLKGLDFEETAITWGAVAILLLGRGAFRVSHDRLTPRSSIWRVPLAGLAGLGIAALAIWVTEGNPPWHVIARETGDLLIYGSGPIHFQHAGASIPLGVHVLEVTTLLLIAYLVFRPLATPRALPSPTAREAAADLVRAHGYDSLSFFKLRADKHYFFSSDRRAFVGYRIENGVVLCSGDPVGAQDAFRGLHTELQAFAEAHGLKRGAVGASERLCPLYEDLGLRTVYLGDEAIVDLVLKLGRQGAPERGFSMALDSLRGHHRGDTLLLLARDQEGAVRGVLHFVPCYGRATVSLSFMRRDPATPNGLMEFMVVQAIELLRERAITELSLNFAAFAKWLHSPQKRAERALGRVVALGNPFFQIESLYRFNAKFFPRWEPRYLVYEGTFGLPRAGIAALWAEGQLWKPALGRSQAGI